MTSEREDTDQRPGRCRTLTPKGQELYEERVASFSAKLRQKRELLEAILEERSLDLDDKHTRIYSMLDQYEQSSTEFLQYLEGTNTLDSQREAASHDLITRSLCARAYAVIKGIEVIQRSMASKKSVAGSVRSTPPSVVRSVRSAPESMRSNSSSTLLVKQRMKVEALKAEFNFTRRESEIQRELTLLQKQKELAVADAELNAIREELQDSDIADSVLGQEVDDPTQALRYQDGVLSPTALTFEPSHSMPSQHVAPSTVQQPRVFQGMHSTPVVTTAHMSPTAVLPPGTAYTMVPPLLEPYSNNNISSAGAFLPTFDNNTGAYSDMSKFLIKKDLLLTRLSAFEDRPETYLSWKGSFRAIMTELSVTASEEVDLLIKYLGVESKRWANSLKVSNACNLGRAVSLIWERLDERFGSPEFVEEALKSKLDKFSEIKQNQCKKLFDLADILAEIECHMSNPVYQQLFAYFNTSSGVKPIAEKLFPALRTKWMNRAMRYKSAHGVVFPPFSEFCAFIREMSKWYNDPAFSYQSNASAAPNQTVTASRDQHKQIATASRGQHKQSLVSACKTDVSAPDNKCPLHTYGNHLLNDCRAFRKKSLTERKKILRENRICFKCCTSTSHRYNDCTAAVKCDNCESDSHPTALHVGTGTGSASRTGSNSQQQPQSAAETHGGERTQAPVPSELVTSKCTSICGKDKNNRSCAKTVLVRVFPANNPDKCLTLYAILDDQSNGTLARTELFDTMNISDTNTIQYTLTSCSGSMTRCGRQASGLVIQTIDGQQTMQLPPVLECNDIPDERNEIPTPEILQHFPHLTDVELPPLDRDAQILLLIGRDMVDAHIVKDQRTGPSNAPFAQRLALGWVVVGNVCLGKVHGSDNIVVTKTCILGDGRPTTLEPCPFHLVVKECMPTDLGNDVFIRTKHDDKPAPSIEDRKFVELMDQEFTKDSNGHGIAPLPFRTHRQRLPNNRPMALRRAHSFQANLRRDSVKRNHVVDFMQGLIQRGHAEIAPSLQDGEECWYLPLFGVYHPKKKDKIRVVFDSSAKYEGVSLNDVLMSGPNLTNDLVGVLLRFRREAVAVVADIEQMFYGFYVSEKHRNYLRFWWFLDNDPEKELVEYRMCVHVFGNSPSPAVATYGLRRCVQVSGHKDKQAVEEYVTNDFYVDDGLGSHPTPAQAIDVLKKTQLILDEEGKLRLHKIASNSPEVLAAFAADDLAKDLINLDLLHEELPSHNSLGLRWDISTDSFAYEVPEDNKPCTRRGILSAINSLFDPLGFLAPVTIQGRLLLRDITAETKDWDQPLSEETQQLWETWKASLHPLKDFSIPRTYSMPGLSSCVKHQLHVFCDASEQAISAVSYIRAVQDSGQIQVGFVCGKSKVAPKHGHTIPRLELCAAVLAVELADMVSEQLGIKQDDIRYHSDSQVVLGYLYNERRRFFTYVANRVGRIRKSSLPQQWKYVSTGDNPADQGTRYVPPDQITHSMWIKGPPFLAKEDFNDEEGTDYEIVDPTDDKEIRPAIATLKTRVDSNDGLGSDRFKNFSSWTGLVSAMSMLRHLASSFRVQDNQTCQGWHLCDVFKTPDSTSRAERLIVLESQRDSFQNEITQLKAGRPLCRSSPVLALAPYLDHNGILRVGGRLRHADIATPEKEPILISGQHHIATLLIRHFHQSIQHQGRHFTEGAVRAAGYWITGGKRLISSLLFKCMKCRRMRGRLSQQKMANLPPDRLTSSPPFTYVGVDVFGPWEVVTRRTRGGSANSKRWGVLFTCLACRAIHIELVEEMSTSSFINALRRFYALRGAVKEFRSDRGTNFVGAIEELQIGSVNVEDPKVKDMLHKSGTIWKFNTPHSSHMGGSWERMIGITRKILDSLLLDSSRSKLTHEVLSTFMAEVCAIVNSRPLVPVSSDAESPFILSPGALLTQKAGDLPEELPSLSLKDMYRSQWRFVQVLANTFWARWRREYLQTLQPRMKWQDINQNLKVGNLILLKDKELHRNYWPLGIVNRVFPSNDGLVRKLEVRIVKDGQIHLYVRPVTEVVLLLDS